MVGSPVRHKCGRRLLAPPPDWRSSDSSCGRTGDGCWRASGSPSYDADVPSAEERRERYEHRSIGLNLHCKKIPANHIQELLYLVLSFLVKDKQRPHCWEGLFSADFHIYLKTVKDIDFVDIDGVNIGCNIASTRG